MEIENFPLRTRDAAQPWGGREYLRRYCYGIYTQRIYQAGTDGGGGPHGGLSDHPECGGLAGKGVLTEEDLAEIQTAIDAQYIVPEEPIAKGEEPVDMEAEAQ